MICSNCVVNPANAIRRVVAARIPTKIARVRCSGGKPAAARPITTALSGQHQVDRDDLDEGNRSFAVKKISHCGHLSGALWWLADGTGAARDAPRLLAGHVVHRHPAVSLENLPLVWWLCLPCQ